MADAVTVEPVSAAEFPGNREKYREIFRIPVFLRLWRGKESRTPWELSDKIGKQLNGELFARKQGSRYRLQET
jgi:hypothetical protein